jgi:DNA-binding transcriptional ArsR family regulator
MSRPESHETFWALSDPVRVEILDRVASGSQVTVTQLAGVLPMSRQAVSRHARTLEEAGLLVGMKSGREHRYRVDLAVLDEAGKWLQARTASWESALGRLGDYLESGAD